MQMRPVRTYKYELPAFLEGRVDAGVYRSWLAKKASAHVKRDRKRVVGEVLREVYKSQIHSAVVQSAGRDWYTGEA